MRKIIMKVLMCCIILGTAMLLASCSCGTEKAKDEKEYKSLFGIMNKKAGGSLEVKMGDYVFDMMYVGDVTTPSGVYDSKHSTLTIYKDHKKIKEMDVNGYPWVNEKKVYYLQDNSLHEYDIDKEKQYSLCDIPEKQKESDSNELNYIIKYVYGDSVILCVDYHGDYANEEINYLYSLKTGDMYELEDGYCLLNGFKDYFVCTDDYDDPYNPKSLYLYKINTKNVKKIKTITDHGNYVGFDDDKLYYSSYPKGNGDRKTVNLYSCDKDGKNSKKESTIKKDNKELFIVDLRDDETCWVSEINGDKDWTPVSEPERYNFKENKWED